MFAAKYAAFIVPAFAVTVLIFAVMIGFTLARARHWRRRYETLTRDAKPRP